MDGGEHEGPGPPGSVRRDADGFVMPDLPVKSPAKSEGPRLVEREGKDDGFPVPPPRPMSRDTGASAALEKPNSSAQVDGAAEVTAERRLGAPLCVSDTGTPRHLLNRGLCSHDAGRTRGSSGCRGGRRGRRRGDLPGLQRSPCTLKGLFPTASSLDCRRARL